MTRVSLSNAVISGAFDGFFYVEQPDHTSGIRVEWPDDVPTERYASVTGYLETRNGVERQIHALSVTTGDIGSIEPLGMPTRSLVGANLGSEAPFAQLGRPGGCGPNNVGLLVRLWGKVIPETPSSFRINDGSGVCPMVILPAGVSAPSEGRFVRVTGICSVEASPDGPAGIILVHDTSDVVPMD